MFFDKLTNLLTAHQRKLYSLDDHLTTPVLEVKFNPISKRYAVFFKLTAKSEWEELTAWGISMIGEPSYPRLLRSRFRFMARWRMCVELDRMFHRSESKGRFI